jgi:hypothetical protein
MSRPTNVLWLIDHVCYDGSLHGGGRLFMNLVPKFDPARVRIPPYFLRASPEVQEVFKTADRKVTNLNLGKYDLRTLAATRTALLASKKSTSCTCFAMRRPLSGAWSASRTACRP